MATTKTIPNPSIYTAALTQSLKELADLMAEREDLDEKMEGMDHRIAKLRRAALGVGSLCGKSRAQMFTEHPELFPDDIDPDTGLTDAVREALKAYGYSMTPVEVRDHLKRKGYDVTKYKNVLASLHTILKRLKTQDEVREGNRDGRTTYKWIPKTTKPGTVEADDIPF